MERTVAAVVLAAGSGTRLHPANSLPGSHSGGPRPVSSKLLLDYGGSPIIVAVVGAVLDAGVIERTVVVLGHAAQEIRETLKARWGDHPDLLLIDNPQHRIGQAGSVRAGLQAALPADGVLFCLGDQPLVTSDTVRRLVRAYRDASPAPKVVAPVHRGRRGNPVLFDQALYPEILQLSGDTGPRCLIPAAGDRSLAVECGLEVLVDVDTWEDYRSLPRPE